MFTTETCLSALIGTRIKLDRQTDRERPCCDNVATIGGGGTSMFAANLTCATCGRHRGWLSESTIKFIQEVRARFGRPEVITLRTPPGSARRLASATRSRTTAPPRIIRP
jgi:hypothetical protein